ncbi:MAG: anthranilate synthase component I family protein [Nitrospinae bacterium]|nr:anthranilate synthase component I family protein [Nitrospinota bacterium]MBI3814692.1 anthranilate synthase component I family protein [Nitrospinota bacterium]
MTKIFPDNGRFDGLRPNNAVIPIFTILRAIGESPLGLFERIFKDQPFVFLLHSGKTSPDYRYSFLGSFHEPFIKGSSRSNPIEQLQLIIDNSRSENIDYLPHFWGGAVGYFGYDIARFIERIPLIAPDDLNIPDLYIGWTDEVIVFDHLENIVKVIVCLKRGEDYKEGVERLKRLVSKIRSQKSEARSQKFIAKNLKANMTKYQFMNIVKRAKEYIKAGDIFQANLSQRFDAEFEGGVWEFYKRLNKINPSPFGGYIKFDDMYIASASPERLIKVTPYTPPFIKGGTGGLIETRPIAGTRPRGKDSTEDKSLSAELLLNEKERAEHIMLVDLERNDLGRVCKYGTVKVDELMTLESYSHVWHIVSKVVGELRDDVKFIDILRACFPGGTITGCPKVRCMEIIEELEPVRRGIYTGSMGYIGYDGRADLNIIIRSALIKNSKIYFHAGAGIVADSEPEKEYEETLFKARAIMEALT